MPNHYRLGITAIITLGILVAGWLGYQYQLKPATTGQITVDNLSRRAEEFIASSSSQGTGLWSEVDLTNQPTETLAANQRLTTPCFSLINTWPLIKVKLEVTDTRCSLRARVVDPPAYLTITSYYHADPTQDTGLRLRRKNPNTYQSVELDTTLPLATAAFTTDHELTLFAWHDTTLFSLALTELPHPERVQSNTLEALVSSLELAPAAPPSQATTSASLELSLPSDLSL